TGGVRFLVGTVWLTAFIGKLMEPCPLLALLGEFARAAGPLALGAAAWALIAVEGGLAAAILVGPPEWSRRTGLASGLAAMVLLLGYVAIAVRLDRLVDCPCFGFRLPGGSFVVLGKSLALLLASLWLWRVETYRPETPPSRTSLRFAPSAIAFRRH